MTFASARTSMLTTCISAIANRNLRNSVGQGFDPQIVFLVQGTGCGASRRQFFEADQDANKLSRSQTDSHSPSLYLEPGNAS